MAAVIFDVDGTLIDSVDLHARSWVETLEYFGFPADFEDVRLNIGKGGDQLAPGFVPAKALAEMAERIEAHRAALFKSDYLAQVRPFPGVRPLFDRIRADGADIVLASSAKADEVADYLKILGVEDLVAGWTSSDDADRSKPFPDIFEAALRKLPGAEPGSAVVVGDTPYDAEAARAARLDCVGVLCGGFSSESLLSAGCAEVYRDPEHLLQHYDASALGRITSGAGRPQGE